MKLKINLIGKCMLMLLFMACTNFAIAQRTISGTLMDGETNEPLIGASVIAVGTTSGTITDFDGKYTLTVPEGVTALEFSYTGFGTKTMQLTDSNVMDLAMTSGTLLDEVVVVGYGAQNEKEITSAVVKLDAEDFNQGDITDPAQLMQGKVAGLQVYNRGGDPNAKSVIRLRGISTVGANSEPLIVIDGIIGATLDNLDPNDIESINVLKDGSASAIYGSRGSSGVIIVTTKKGTAGQGVKFSYNGQLASSTPLNPVQIMDAGEFVAAGGTDLGSTTDWVDEVTRTAFSNYHSLAATGGIGDNSSFRVSANLRNGQGILDNTGFNQFNTRLNFRTAAFNDRLTIDLNTSLLNRKSDNGFDEALRYAVLYNPTSPVLGSDSPYAFNSDQFGGFFETLGLFDSFNPKSIIEQNKNQGERRESNLGALFGYSILDNLKVNFRLGRQNIDFANRIYYPTTSLFKGNATSPIRRGLAEVYEENLTSQLFETFATYIADLGSSNLTVTGGYSYQQDNFNSFFLSAGDFPDGSLDFSNILEASQDLNNAGLIDFNSQVSPDEKIIAFFGRANWNMDDKFFVNASLRREGSTKLGADNRWGIFPAVGVGVDLARVANIGAFDRLKLRAGYGVTGALPRQWGLSQEIREVVNGDDGSVSTKLLRAANPDLKWEQKAETNIGLEGDVGKLGFVIDFYVRDISDFILERNVDPAVFGVDKRVENVGALSTSGIELGLDYDVLSNSNLTWNTGVVFSTYNTVLDEFVNDSEVRGNLGAPGQNGTNMILVRVGEEIGQIWGPVFDSVGEDGAPIFKDLNGDGMVVAGGDNALDENADFEVLGNGIPDFELGWSNQLTIGQWNVNAFFRGAFGHSLVNTFRAFYEPQVSTQSSYNYVNTELAVDGLTAARYSSLYVEKADFFKLDNLTVGRRINFGDGVFNSGVVSLTARNLFTITGYTGSNPEPNFLDGGAEDNGNRLTDADSAFNDPLAPGIDRRNNYFNSRSVTLGIQLNF